MKIRNVIKTILLGIGIIAVFLLVTVLVGQTRTQAPSPPIATAQISFDFWIGDTHLAAGEYALYRVMKLDTLVLFRNTKTNAQEQAFLLRRTGCERRLQARFRRTRWPALPAGALGFRRQSGCNISELD